MINLPARIMCRLCARHDERAPRTCSRPEDPLGEAAVPAARSRASVSGSVLGGLKAGMARAMEGAGPYTPIVVPAAGSIEGRDLQADTLAERDAAQLAEERGLMLRALGESWDYHLTTDGLRWAWYRDGFHDGPTRYYVPATQAQTPEGTDELYTAMRASLGETDD